MRIHCLGKVSHVPRKPRPKLKMSAFLERSTWQQGVPSLRHWFPNPENGHQIFLSMCERVGHFSERKVYSRERQAGGTAQLCWVHTVFQLCEFRFNI